MEEILYYKSQKGMEAWMKKATGPDSNLYKGGVTKMIQPHFTSCNFAEKSAVITFETEDWQRNPGGTIHGGIVVTTMDTSLGVLCHYLAQQRTITTVNIATTFLKPINIHDTIDIAVRATSAGRTLVSLTCDLRVRQRQNILAATGNATFMILDRDYDRPIP